MLLFMHIIVVSSLFFCFFFLSFFYVIFSLRHDASPPFH